MFLEHSITAILDTKLKKVSCTFFELEMQEIFGVIVNSYLKC